VKLDPAACTTVNLTLDKTFAEKKSKVFATTLGHNNATMEAPVYLDLVTRGLLWACDKLNEDGTPKAGYGPGGK